MESVFSTEHEDDSYLIPGSVQDEVAIGSSTWNSPVFLMPPGCTCRKAGAINSEQCDEFDCTCQCDLTAGACDFNCCCDKECTEDEVLSFSSCLDEGYPAPMANMCVEGASALEEVNVIYPHRVNESPNVSMEITEFII